MSRLTMSTNASSSSRLRAWALAFLLLLTATTPLSLLFKGTRVRVSHHHALPAPVAVAGHVRWAAQGFASSSTSMSMTASPQLESSVTSTGSSVYSSNNNTTGDNLFAVLSPHLLVVPMDRGTPSSSGGQRAVPPVPPSASGSFGPAGGLGNLQRRLTISNKRTSRYSPIKKMLRSVDGGSEGAADASSLPSSLPKDAIGGPVSSQSTAGISKPYGYRNSTKRSSMSASAARGLGAVDALTAAVVATPSYADAAIDQFYNILEDPKRSQNDVNIVSINKFIKVLGDMGLLNHCRLVYDALLDYYPHRRLRPTLVTYTTLISKAGNWKNTKLAQFYFDEMNAQHVSPDVQVYNSMMNAYAKKGDDLAKVTNLFHELTTVRGLRPTVVSFNTLIDAYSRAGRPIDAETVFKNMPAFNCTPNERSYASLIHAWCQARKVQTAIDLLRQMEANFGRPSSPIVYSTILHALGKQGKIEEALTMLAEMRSKGGPFFAPNLVILSSLMHACGKHNRMDLAWSIYEQLLQSKSPALRPNSITCSALIDVCLKFGEVDKALSVINDMRTLKIPLTEVTYTSLISELTKLKQLDRILEFAMSSSEFVAGTNVIVVEDDSELPFTADLDSQQQSNSNSDDSNSNSEGNNALFPTSARTISAKTQSEPRDPFEHLGPPPLIIPFTTFPDAHTYANNHTDTMSVTNMTLILPFIDQLVVQSSAVQAAVEQIVQCWQTRQGLSSEDMGGVLGASDLALNILRSQELVSRIIDANIEIDGAFHLGIVGNLADKLKEMAMSLDIRIGAGSGAGTVTGIPQTQQSESRALLLRLAETSRIAHDCRTVISGYSTARQLLAAADVVQEYLLDFPAALELPVESDAFLRLERLFRPTATTAATAAVAKTRSTLAVKQDYSIDILGNYEELTAKGIVPDRQLYGKLIESVYEQSKRQAAHVLANRPQLRHDDLFRLYLVFQEMRSKGVEADAGCYNTLINACADSGDVDRALETMKAMQNEGISPDLITYTSLIKACANSQQPGGVTLAEEIFDAMQQRTNHFSTYIAPTTLTLQWLMQAHIQSPTGAVMNTTRVWQLLDDTVSRSFAPTTKMYRHCLNAAVVDNDAEKALAMLLLLQRSVARDHHRSSGIGIGNKPR